MKIASRNQAGLSHIVLLALLVLLAVVGLVGYRVATTGNDPAEPTSSKQIAVPDNITSASDLEQAKEALNKTDLDSELDPSQFDEDVQELL